MAARLVADIVRDFEPDLQELTLRPFDDGRFIVLFNDKTIFDMKRTNRFPKFAEEIKPILSEQST